MKKAFILTLLFSIIFVGCESSILDDPSTIIDFQLPQRSHVKVTVENSYNTVIAILVDEDLNGGTYSFPMTMNNLPEGIYFYTTEITGIDSNYYLKTTKPIYLIKP